MNRRAKYLFAPALAVLLGLTACGQSDDSGSNTDDVAGSEVQTTRSADDTTSDESRSYDFPDIGSTCASTSDKIDVNNQDIWASPSLTDEYEDLIGRHVTPETKSVLYKVDEGELTDVFSDTVFYIGWSGAQYDRPLPETLENVRLNIQRAGGSQEIEPTSVEQVKDDVALYQVTFSEPVPSEKEVTVHLEFDDPFYGAEWKDDADAEDCDEPDKMRAVVPQLSSKHSATESISLLKKVNHHERGVL